MIHNFESCCQFTLLKKNNIYLYYNTEKQRHMSENKQNGSKRLTKTETEAQLSDILI